MKSVMSVTRWIVMRNRKKNYDRYRKQKLFASFINICKMADESETPKTASNAPNTVSEQKIYKSNKPPFIIFLKNVKADSFISSHRIENRIQHGEFSASNCPCKFANYNRIIVENLNTSDWAIAHHIVQRQQTFFAHLSNYRDNYGILIVALSHRRLARHGRCEPAGTRDGTIGAHRRRLVSNASKRDRYGSRDRSRVPGTAWHRGHVREHRALCVKRVCTLC